MIQVGWRKLKVKKKKLLEIGTSIKGFVVYWFSGNCIVQGFSSTYFADCDFFI